MNYAEQVALMAPLSLYVVWHPDFVEGKVYADHFYKTFCRDSDKPITRGLGINVYYRSKNLVPEVKLPPIPINYDDSNYNVVIVLIDDLMVIGDDWEEYVTAIWERCKSDNSCLFLPVAISNHAYNLSQSVAFANFIKPLKSVAQVTKESIINNNAIHFSNSIAHEICRLLLNNEDRWSNKNDRNGVEEDLIPLSPAPVKLFISHAKADGEALAIKIRDYLNSGSSIKTFFDAVDIAPGYDFTTEIGGSIQRSALLVVLTDAYATREWCKKEVIKAKSENKPIIVINALQVGEPRSFPYLGNSPTLRWNEDELEEMVGVALLEILNQLYQEMHLSNIANSLNANGENQDEIIIWPNQPELFSFINILKKFESRTALVKTDKKKPPKDEDKKGERVLLYPDPPLGEDEKNIIRDLISGIRLETPSSISARY